MNIGGVSNINYIAAAGRLSAPALRYPAPAVSPAVPSNIPASIPAIMSPTQGNAALFFSIDGDMAEISYGLLKALEPQGVCHTCENRKYVDRSNDASVSFQTPTGISPNMAAAAVASHEQEHVRNEQARAHRDDREIINQTVTLQYDTCPECGKHYVSGGTTKTTSISKSDSEDMFDANISNEGEKE